LAKGESGSKRCGRSSRLAVEGRLASRIIALAVLPVALPVRPPLAAVGTLALRPAFAPFAAFAFRSRLELRAVEARFAGTVALVSSALLGRPIAWLATRRGLAGARTIVTAVARTLMIEARLPPQKDRLRLFLLGRGFATFTLALVGRVGA